MAKFLNYRNVEFKLSGYNYYATRLSLSAKSSVEPVILNDGSLLNYAPNGAVVGGLSAEFYLTGALPNFLLVTGVDESAVSGNFAGVAITGLHPKSIRFNVEPFQPILMSVDFDWYGNINVTGFDENTQAAKNNIPTASYIANGYQSYMSTGNLSGVENVLSLEYGASCDRPAFYHVDDTIPVRVAKLNKTATVSLNSNKLGDQIDIDGKSVSSTITLKDIYGAILNTFNISGVLTSQSYEVSEGQYMISSAEIMQTVVEKKTLV